MMRDPRIVSCKRRTSTQRSIPADASACGEDEGGCARENARICERPEAGSRAVKSMLADSDDETKSVAPLLQFFELVHIGDTMQSMIQVYFDKELVSLPLLVSRAISDPR